MSETKGRGLLESVLQHPDDDAKRLIYADWLEEEGDAERAEFIRVQIEQAQLPEWDSRRVRLEIRADQLIQKNGNEWKAELPQIPGITWGMFRRGFIATAIFSNMAVFRKEREACWDAAPIEAVKTRWPRGSEAIERTEPIPGLRELSIQKNLVALPEVERLADAPLLTTLRVLNLPKCSLGPEGFQRLVLSPHLGHLTTLGVPHNSIGNTGVAALLRAPSLTNLEELDLSESGSWSRYAEDPIMDTAGVKALVAWKGMPKLRSLKLSGNNVKREGVQALLRSPNTRGLRKLYLRDNDLDGQVMQEFGSAHQDLRLDVLDLGENWLQTLGMADLRRANCLAELKVLEIDRCEMDLSAAHELAKAPFLDSLRKLNVNENSFGPDGLMVLLEASPRHLHTLQLDNNNLGDEGLGRLGLSPSSNTLLKLDLSTNQVKAPGTKALASSKHLQNLMCLRLQYNHIGQDGVAVLKKSPLGKRLAFLDVKDQWFPEDESSIPF
ncbi:MAG: TIGR02996 domain-containing protein [Gemmataceae bacterium]